MYQNNHANSNDNYCYLCLSFVFNLIIMHCFLSIKWRLPFLFSYNIRTSLDDPCHFTFIDTLHIKIFHGVEIIVFELLAILLAFFAVSVLYLTNKYQYLTLKPAQKKYRKWAYGLILLSTLSLLVTMSLLASVYSVIVVIMLIGAMLPFFALLFKGATSES